MYSYQHRYHAGNLADLQKHTVLWAILEAFHAKETPFGVVDAFAGEGVYDLSCAEAQKTKEYEEGEMWASHFPYQERLAEVASLYLTPPLLRPYAGSPALIRASLRPQDEAIFIENHPHAHSLLVRTFGADGRIRVQKKDAYQALSGLLPLSQPRGLILLDPSYEVKDEYTWIPQALQRGLKKYRHGVFMVWYPLLAEKRHESMVESIRSWALPNLWVWEWLFKDPPSTTRLYGSGVLVINLPYAAQQILDPLRPLPPKKEKPDPYAV